MKSTKIDIKNCKDEIKEDIVIVTHNKQLTKEEYQEGYKILNDMRFYFVCVVFITLLIVIIVTNIKK